MKKSISIIILITVILSCCACGTKTPANNQPVSQQAETLDPMSHEAVFGHIDQTVPQNGVYQIWNAEGVQQMFQHPDASFELLCDVDMAGCTLSPIGEFTGTIVGGNFVISNFTVQGGNETDFGFVTVNKGEIRNLTLRNVTFAPGEAAKNIGTLAGINEGQILRCTVEGTLSVEKAADQAACGALVGRNTGSIANVELTVNTNYAAAQAAFVGGILGVGNGGMVEYVDNYGALTISGANKTAGLFAGDAKDVVFVNCVFSGADNSLDNKFFTNFTGTPDDDELVVAQNARWRDNAIHAPLPENVRAAREKVVEEMYNMGSVKWTLNKDLIHSCTCDLTICHGVFNTDYTYYGAPYNHKASSYARFLYCQNEDGSMKDWFYDQPSFDGYDTYIGSDCSAAVQLAWFTVSNSVCFGNTGRIPPIYGRGTIAVGDYVCNFRLEDAPEYRTRQYIQATDEQVMYESYAAMRMGDAIVAQRESGGHTRMAAVDPVVIRDQAGKIDPVYSYLLTHEQGAETVDEINRTFSSWKLYEKYNFATLMQTEYIPVTCEELLSGELEPVEATLEGKTDGFAGMFSGIVKTNYHLDSVTLKIVDESGNVLLEHPLWVTLARFGDGGSNYDKARIYMDEYDIAGFAQVLTGVTFTRGMNYSYTVTADLATHDHITVNEGSFIYG